MSKGVTTIFFPCAYQCMHCAMCIQIIINGVKKLTDCQFI